MPELEYTERYRITLHRPGFGGVFAGWMTTRDGRLCMTTASSLWPQRGEHPALNRPGLVRTTAIGSAAFECDSASVFERVFADDVAVCVWNRPQDEILCDYLKRTVRSGTWQRTTRVDPIEPEFDEVLYDFADGLGKIRLVTELSGLVDLFATLADAQRVGVRMTATMQRECPRFHVDRVGLQLLCTWVGEGTEWLAHEDVIRERLGHQLGGRGEVKKPRAKVHRMQPFAVGALKGEAWPGNVGRGAVHRSPAPASCRVFVSLDAL
jgi:hypothetical protein